MIAGGWYNNKYGNWQTVASLFFYSGDAILLAQIMKEKMLKLSDLETMDSRKLTEMATACNIQSRGKSMVRDFSK